MRVFVFLLAEPSPIDHLFEPGLERGLVALILLQLGDVVVEEIEDLIVVVQLAGEFMRYRATCLASSEASTSSII